MKQHNYDHLISVSASSSKTSVSEFESLNAATADIESKVLCYHPYYNMGSQHMCNTDHMTKKASVCTFKGAKLIQFPRTRLKA